MPKRRQTVLDEDTYLRSIDDLIERQFFPDSELLALENAYLEAVASNDIVTMKNLTIRRRELEAKTPSTRLSKNDYIPNTPARPGETPKKETKNEHDDLDIKPELLDEKDLESEDYETNPTITLNGFLSKHTSEDNEQYHKIQREIDYKKHLAKYRWVYELDNKHRKHVPYATCDAGLGISAKQKLNEKTDQLIQEYREEQADKQLALIPAGEAADKEVDEADKVDEEGKPVTIIKDNKIVRQDESLYKEPKDQNASKILNNWRYISKNNVMFYREAIGSKYDDGKFKKPMQINYEATRFKERDPYAKQMERLRIEKAYKNASMFKAGQVQKDGSSVNQDGSWTPGLSLSTTPGRTPVRLTPGLPGTTPLTGITPFGNSVRANSISTPSGSALNGFVPNTPNLTPGRGADESPLMTWGAVDGTTQVAMTPTMNGEKLAGECSRYRLPGVLKRELVHEKLLEKVKCRDRMKKSKVMDRVKKGILGATPDRLGSVLSSSKGGNSARLTPGAKRLASSSFSGIKSGSSRRLGGTPLVRLTPNKRKNTDSVNCTPTPSSSFGGGMVAAKLSKLGGVTKNLL